MLSSTNPRLHRRLRSAGVVVAVVATILLTATPYAGYSPLYASPAPTRTLYKAAAPTLASSWVTEVGEGDSDDGEDGGGNQWDVDTVFNGFVVSTPGTFIGDWIIAPSYGVTETVIVDENTQISRFRGKLPPPGAWVKVRGNRQPNGPILAMRLRADDYAGGQVVVRFEPDCDIDRLLEQYALQWLSDSKLLQSGHIYLFGTDEDFEENLVDQLKADSCVVWAELNYANGIPNFPEGSPYRTWKWGSVEPTGYWNQTAFEQVNLSPAEANYQGDGIIVALLDTGIDLDHPALAGKWVEGYDMVADNTTPLDEGPGIGWGHGTHIAGILTRIAPDAKLLPVRVLDVNGRGNTFILAYAIEWSVDQGADVINLSLGADFDSAVLRDAVADAVDQGVIIVAAAGNDADSKPRYPAAYPGVLAVTAVDSTRVKADFANYDDGSGWIDLAAPGVGITSTIVGGDDSLYATWSGTSMATPFVSGAAALARQKLPNVTAAAIATLLTEKGDDISAADPIYGPRLGRHLDIGAAVVDVPNQGTWAHRLYLPAVLQE